MTFIIFNLKFIVKNAKRYLKFFKRYFLFYIPNIFAEGMMQSFNISKEHSFYAIGLSYKKADAEVRGCFSLDDTSKRNLLEQAKQEGVESLFVISTCNRTEIYGFAQHSFQLIKLLCDNTKGTVEQFRDVAYVHKNSEAVSHMFKVGSGLDSQILGDFEIISQLKVSARKSKKQQLLNPFMERLVNAVIQASKRIKTETEISSGATSVSFASVHYILNNVKNPSGKNILLFGTGKIGRDTCENLVKHTKNSHITLINRTREKADAVAGKFNLVVKDFDHLENEIKNADILIVATGAQNPTVVASQINENRELLILDLSIPRNAHPNIAKLPNVTLVHLDDLSKITDETLEKRKQQIPIAKSIIEEVESDFNAWLETRKFAPTIKALKHKLQNFAHTELEAQRKKSSDFNEAQAELISNNIIQKITNHFAHHLKEDYGSTDESLELIKKVFQLESTADV